MRDESLITGWRRAAWRGTVLAVVALALSGPGCRDEAPAGAPVKPPSWDDREAAALKGSGAELPDTRSEDDGLGISDAQASLFDEELCNEACGHLFDLLAAEQRKGLADDPEALDIFLKDLDALRQRRTPSCVADCRRYADLDMVRCVRAATDRESLDRCDF